jgi:transglutaminase-like putative cysteine protease
MANLARRAARNPDFVNAIVRLFGAWRPTIEDMARVLRPLFVYREEYEEVVRTPEFMLNDLVTLGRIEGDCDDISTLLAAIAVMVGYRVRFVAIRYTPTVAHFEHVFVEMDNGDKWYAVDLTIQSGRTINALEVMIEGV